MSSSPPPSPGPADASEAHSPLSEDAGDSAPVPGPLAERYARLAALRRRVDAAAALNRLEVVREQATRARAQNRKRTRDVDADAPEKDKDSERAVPARVPTTSTSTSTSTSASSASSASIPTTAKPAGNTGKQKSGGDDKRRALLAYSIEDTEAWNRSRGRKNERADHGFADCTQASLRKYKRLTAQLKPDVAEYMGTKRRLVAASSEPTSEPLICGAVSARGSASGLLAENKEALRAFHGDINAVSTTLHGKVPAAKVDRMCADLAKQVETRNKSSRRRAYDPDEDVTFINDKNRHFNKKISRAFDKYTIDIKESLERGTNL